MTFYLFIFLCLLILFTVLYLKGGDHAPFLAALFSAAFLTRLVVSGYLYFQAWQKGADSFFLGDDGLYFFKGLVLYDFSKTNINHIPLIVPNYLDPYGFGFLETVGLIPYLHYFLFCFFSVSIIYTKMIAIFAASLAPIIFYFTCLRLCGKKIAKLSSVLFAFWPSYFYYSLGGYKEPYMLLSVAALLGIGLLLFEKPRWPLLYLALPLFPIYFLVPKAVFALFLLLFLLLALFRMFERQKKILIFLCLGALAVIPFMVKDRHLHDFIDKQLNMSIADDAGYSLYPYRLEISGAPSVVREGLFKGNHLIFSSWLFILLKGLAYAIFSPFLWDIPSKTQLMAYPQSLFILLGFFFLVRGVCLSTTSYARFFFPVVFTIFIFVVGFSLTEGNIGAAFRHRELFLPCYLLFFSAGFLQTLHYKDADSGDYLTKRL